MLQVHVPTYYRYIVYIYIHTHIVRIIETIVRPVRFQCMLHCKGTWTLRVKDSTFIILISFGAGLGLGFMV